MDALTALALFVLGYIVGSTAAHLPQRSTRRGVRPERPVGPPPYIAANAPHLPSAPRGGTGERR